MHCSYLNTKMEFHTGQRNRLNNQHPNFSVYHIINILYIPEARSCTSLTSIFSLLETGPAQLLSYSIKQITWGNTKMVIKHRAEDLDDVYWAQEHTMLFEGVHKVNLEIIKTPGYLNFIQDDADFWFIYFLFMPLPHQYSDSTTYAPCNPFLQVSNASASTSGHYHARGASSALSNDDIRRPCVWAGEGKCPICIYFHPPIFGGPHCISTSCFLFSVGTAD